jgi:HTH-type transcriptional repressor of NAD biosynthesis genes
MKQIRCSFTATTWGELCFGLPLLSGYVMAANVTSPRAYRQGLVVGKFCPLHRGHMHLIGAAVEFRLGVTDDEHRIAGRDRCGPAVRQAWLDALFPQVRSLALDDAILARLCAQRGLPVRQLPHNDDDAAVHRDFTAWVGWALCDTRADAVFTSEDYGDDFAAALGAWYGAQLAETSQVRHVCVDRHRQTVPVSGTAARAQPHLAYAFLHPAVRAHFVDRVCLLGGESSGKTTLAAALAARLGTCWAPEVARERWEQQGGALGYDDMLIIGQEQVAREDAMAREARRWLVCDGSALTSLFYSLDGFGRAEPALDALARRPYAAVFVCAPDFPFVQDGTRRDAPFRARQHAWYLETLAGFGMAYTLLEGDPAQRLATACAALTPCD